MPPDQRNQQKSGRDKKQTIAIQVEGQEGRASVKAGQVQEGVEEILGQEMEVELPVKD